MLAFALTAEEVQHLDGSYPSCVTGSGRFRAAGICIMGGASLS